MGHELGNHTIFHPALSLKAWVREGNEIEAYTLDRMRLELEVANNILCMLDGRTERTFAFPCGFTRIGRIGLPNRLASAVGLGGGRIARLLDSWHLDFGSTVADYTPIVEELFFAARCGSITRGDTPAIQYSRYHVPSFAGDGKGAKELVALLDEAAGIDSWLVFSFHGIGGGHGLYCETEEFELFLQHLAANKLFAVKTFLDASKDTWG